MYCISTFIIKGLLILYNSVYWTDFISDENYVDKQNCNDISKVVL